ncbi:protein spaetzle isoform X3 [Drosophila sechellia]|uniref:protein spaetzle isoform X3 n=1 Tax=Drosophila sechellia TaxID=7238 RepID=UPI0013DDC8B1|nr:protein spaetzle isoform X3 [Drosophila sechellia]
MTPMWISLFKVLLLLSAFVGMIVYIKIVITKRDEAEVRAAKTEALLAIMNNGEPRESASYHLQYEPKEYDGIIKEIFTVNNDKGVVLFNTTADSAPFMPIPTQHDDLPQKQNQKQNQSPIPETNRHYHQYHSLIQPDQYFKRTDTEVQSEQPTPPRHPSDTFVFPDSPIAKYRPPQSPPRSLRNDTKERNPCAKDESQHLRNFCTNVDDYPDLSGLTQKLKNNFAKFFSNDLQPTDVSSRVGGSDERFLCRSIRKLVYPKKGMRADDTWQFIVNNDEYKQAIQIEECEGADQPCDFAANFPQSYNPICKQHYTQQTLASITSDGEVDVVQHSFKIPSCCKCALKTG